MIPFKTLIVLVLVHVNAFAFTVGAADERGGTYPVLSAVTEGFAIAEDDNGQHGRDDFYFSSLLLNDDGTRPYWFQFKTPIALLPVNSFSGRPVNMPPNMHLNIFSPPPERLAC